MSAGTTPLSLFKRTVGKRKLYYARILDTKTGRVVRTVSTKKTSYVGAVRWMDQYLQREHEQYQKAKNIVTVEELPRGFWKMDAPYARGRLSRGKSISHGHLDIGEGYTRNHIIPVWGSRRVNEVTAGEIGTCSYEIPKEASGKAVEGFTFRSTVLPVESL